VKRKVRDWIWSAAGRSIPGLQKVMLDQPVQVEFSKNWKPNSSSRVSSHLDAEGLQRIKDGLSGMVLEGFKSSPKGATGHYDAGR
jgi:hypothetical protein